MRVLLLRLETDALVISDDSQHDNVSSKIWYLVRLDVVSRGGGLYPPVRTSSVESYVAHMIEPLYVKNIHQIPFVY